MNAVFYYRIGHWLYRRRVPILPKLFYWLTFLLFNSSIPPSCEIGKESRFAYGAVGVVLHGRCRIGDRVLIGQNVTVGGTFGSGVPVIGDNVWIAAGARILGDVRVGSNVIVGANAVVIKDIPDNCIAAGVPVRILRTIAPDALDALAGRLIEAPSAT